MLNRLLAACSAAGAAASSRCSLWPARRPLHKLLLAVVPAVPLAVGGVVEAAAAGIPVHARVCRRGSRSGRSGHCCHCPNGTEAAATRSAERLERVSNLDIPNSSLLESTLQRPPSTPSSTPSASNPRARHTCAVPVAGGGIEGVPSGRFALGPSSCHLLHFGNQVLLLNDARRVLQKQSGCIAAGCGQNTWHAAFTWEMRPLFWCCSHSSAQAVGERLLGRRL